MTELTARPAATRGWRAAALGGLAAVTGYVYLADPDRRGVYPQCPSRTLLGIDCPACGGLRGTNALLHGRITEALDHNLLLPGYLGLGALVIALWMLPLVGRPERRLQLPRWLWATLGAAVVAFAVARNLPIDSLHVLRSDA
jgi:hypothetical protein